jgi:hypothetical protein
MKASGSSFLVLQSHTRLKAIVQKLHYQSKTTLKCDSHPSKTSFHNTPLKLSHMHTHYFDIHT